VESPFGWYDSLTTFTDEPNKGDGSHCAGRHELIKVRQKKVRTALAVPTEEMPVTKLTKKTILCIGDDLVGLNLRCALLKEHGWNVISSSSGHDGVTRFGQENIDAVVLDLNKDGTESALIADALKRQRPDVRIIMVVRDQAALVRGASAQADAVVLKLEEGSKLNEALRKLFRVH
jgi:CheY-like chemotaxis protein